MARYLDALRAAPGARDLMDADHALLQLVTGQCVLDVGCGPGDDARAFAAAVGSNGTVIAVDRDPEMLRLARARSATDGIQLDLRLGDACALALEDEAVDCAFSSRVLHHAPAAEKLVGEMVRATRRGGRVVFSMEPDWDTLVVDVPDLALARHILAVRSDCYPNPASGRRLRGLAMGAGLAAVHVRPHTYVIRTLKEDGQSLPIPWEREIDDMRTRDLVTADEASRWIRLLRDADAEGRFFAAVTFFTVWGDRRETTPPLVSDDSHGR